MESLQRLLASSWSAKLLAVRQVAQENNGRKTPGIDGVVSTTDEDRVRLLQDGLRPAGLPSAPRTSGLHPEGQREATPSGHPDPERPGHAVSGQTGPGAGMGSGL